LLSAGCDTYNSSRPPLHLPLGDDSIAAILDQLDRIRDDINAWEKRTRATGFGD